MDKGWKALGRPRTGERVAEAGSRCPVPTPLEQFFPESRVWKAGSSSQGLGVGSMPIGEGKAICGEWHCQLPLPQVSPVWVSSAGILPPLHFSEWPRRVSGQLVAQGTVLDPSEILKPMAPRQGCTSPEQQQAEDPEDQQNPAQEPAWEPGILGLVLETWTPEGPGGMAGNDVWESESWAVEGRAGCSDPSWHLPHKRPHRLNGEPSLNPPGLWVP